MSLITALETLEKNLGAAQHHAYLVSSRSLAAEPTPTPLIAHLLSQLSGVVLQNPNDPSAPDAFWEAFVRHPDLLRADPERSILRKEDIELFRERSIYPPTLARRRFLLIENAERMNQQSANSLLKTLEEPLANCVFVLTTARANAIPPTILSRCQKILLPPWNRPTTAHAQLEREDALFLANFFLSPHLATPARLVAVETLTSPQRIQIGAEQLSEWSQWADQAGRRYEAELLRDALVESTSEGLKAGRLSQSRSTAIFALISAWSETDPLHPTNSFWLMRILLTLAN